MARSTASAQVHTYQPSQAKLRRLSQSLLICAIFLGMFEFLGRAFNMGATMDVVRPLFVLGTGALIWATPVR